MVVGRDRFQGRLGGGAGLMDDFIREMVGKWAGAVGLSSRTAV